jgi:hypothetical protein
MATQTDPDPDSNCAFGSGSGLFFNDDVFFDPPQGSPRAPAAVKMPEEYERVRAAHANWYRVTTLSGPPGLNRVWAPQTGAIRAEALCQLGRAGGQGGQHT